MKAIKTIAAAVTSVVLTLAASAFAQTNVQSVQIVGPTPSPSNLQPLSAVSTPSDTVVAPTSTSGSTLGSLIALPQNPSSPPTSTTSATTAPAVSATPFVPQVNTPFQRFRPNLNVGNSVVNITQPVASPGASASPATANVTIQGSQVNQTSQATGTGTGPITPNQNVQIQGAQTNQTATGLTTNTAAKNITIQNSQANNNNPAAVPKGNKGNAGFNRHPANKLKQKDGEQENAGPGQPRQQKNHAPPQAPGNTRGKGKPKSVRTPE